MPSLPSSLSAPAAAEKKLLLVFGPQALSFNSALVRGLRTQLHTATAPSSYTWILDAVAGLCGEWKSVQALLPQLQAYKDGETKLQQLNHLLASADTSGDIDMEIETLPNIVLSPLVVITQLMQYSQFLSAALPETNNADKEERQIPSTIAASIETLGLCTGLLTALAVGLSPTLARLRQHGTTAIRLAMLVGAFVDAVEQQQQHEDQQTLSFSMSWASVKSWALVEGVMAQFPEAYISVRVDDKRATVITTKRTASELIQKLNSIGVHTTDVPLRGRFHNANQQSQVEQLIRQISSSFQFPDASQLVFPTRSNSTGAYLQTGKLHEVALREILVEQSQWYETFSMAYASHLASEYASAAISFGPERCIPPTIARKLGSRLTSIADVKSVSLPANLSSLLGIGNSTHSPNNGSFTAALKDEQVAVIGMACHLPGAEDLDEYWNILAKGESQHREVPSDRFSMETPFRKVDADRKWFGNFIQNHDSFDHKFFKKSPREMASTDPQHRLMMQVAYQAVQQSGYFGVPDFNKHIGCFMGVGNVDYEDNIACSPAGAYSATGNLKSFLAGKISHYFGWTGPSLTLDTACSSSSVAIHQACRAILNGECTAALAGGVNIITSPDWYHNLNGASFLSATGQCKPFDSRADGYCRGEGAGVVLLKRLSDAITDGDQVLGVIASTGVFQNRNNTAITVPDSASLSELFQHVVVKARLDPNDISVVEAHGTGTPVGDPAEYKGIASVFAGQERSHKLALTSVKGLIGHTECASGVASLLKMLLMLQRGFIPPQASFKTLSPALLSATSPEVSQKIEVPTTLEPWKAEFKAALINNYGASGSNASMIVTEAPKLSSNHTGLLSLPKLSFPFFFAANDEQNLRAYTSKFLAFLRRKDLDEKAMTIGNLAFQHFHQSNRSLPTALILTASSTAELEQKLVAFGKGDAAVTSVQLPSPAPPVILTFGGQFSTYVGLDQEVFDNAKVLRQYLDQCDSAITSAGMESIYAHIFQKSPILDVVNLHNALFSLQYATAKAWISCGVPVAACVGHSFGELTALAVTNTLSLQDAVKLISGRARLIRKKWTTNTGAMAVLEADTARVDTLLKLANAAANQGEHEHELAVACYNGPTSFSLAGSVEVIDAAEAIIKSDPLFVGVRFKKLNVTHAFHSSLVKPVIGALEALGEELTVKEPTIGLERSTEVDTSNDGLNPSFAAEHLRKPVFFHHAVQRLAKKYPSAVWLEAGSNSSVTAMASRILGPGSSSFFQSVNVTGDGALQHLADATSRLWGRGVNVRFWPHHPLQVSMHTPVLLPPHQFEKSKHWMELKAPPEPEPVATSTNAVDDREEAQLPVGLTTFEGYEDDSRRSVLFRINNKIEKYVQLVQGHTMAGTAAVCPGLFQMELVMDALMKLRPDFADLTFHPQLHGMEHHNPLCIDDGKLGWIHAVSSDADGLIWDWKIVVSNKVTGALITNTVGTIAFCAAGSAKVQSDFDDMARWISRQRCAQLLDDQNADDVLQGRNIYRAFSPVIDYNELYRHVNRLVGKSGNESAGRVLKTHVDDCWFDSILTDCFCQVAGIFVNLMTNRTPATEHGIFVCDGIKRWLRSPKFSTTNSLSSTWEVLALHSRESDKRYISDVFVFDPRSGALLEVVLGISYQWVSVDGIQKALSRLAPSASAPMPAATFTSTPTLTNGANGAKARINTASVANIMSDINALNGPLKSANAVNGSVKDTKLTNGTSGARISGDPTGVRNVITGTTQALNGVNVAINIETKKSPAEVTSQKPRGPDVESKTREILCNLSGLEPEEIEDDSDLVELGIDSLMSMELTREVDAAFGCTLETADLMDLTDFHSLVTCIRKILGHSTVEDTSVSHMPNVETGKHITNGEMSRPDHKAVAPNDSLPESLVLTAWRETKDTTDEFIVNGNLGTYYNEVMPRSTELCVAHIVNAFEELGCPIRSAAPGQKLERVPYLPKHQQQMDLIYDLLCNDARLIDINGTEMTRTAIPPPSKSVDVLLEELLESEPIHAAEHKLTQMIGSKYAKSLTGEEDGLQMIFGSAQGREIVSDVYAKSPINLVWIQQAEYFLERLISQLPKNGEPFRILEMGAGTGGTTVRLLPMLSRLGVPIKYTMTDLSSSLVAAARKRFKHYPFMEFKVLNIESDPDPQFLNSQHLVLATNCVHATRNLTISTSNIHKILRQDGLLMLLEMSDQIPWVDFIFGLLEGWWLFEDGRKHAIAPPTYWEKILKSVGFGHVDWTEGNRPEANLQRLIIAHASNSRYERVPTRPLDPPLPAQSELTDLAERQTAIDGYIHEFTDNFVEPLVAATPPAGLHSTPPTSAARCVLVTGATGSLGCHIVANMANLPQIETVVCLNRISTVDVVQRQQRSLATKGVSLQEFAQPKLRVLEADTTKPMLGLSKDLYQSLVNTVTDIVHNAWPMSLTRPLRAYAAQFKVMQNLIRLAQEATVKRPAPFKFGFQFISSIGVVGYYPICTGHAVAPEQLTTADTVLPVGYADAKLVCERMLDQTLGRHPERYRAMSVRIAQITGSTINGYWNPTEHFSFLVKSAQTLRMLPDLQHSLSWAPVNDVAGTLRDLLIADVQPYPVYHIENPRRQPWKEMIRLLADALDVPRASIVPFEQWLSRIRRFPGPSSANPAGQLADFFENHFIRMSCEGLILDTSNAREHSETLRHLLPVSDELVKMYINAWKESGVLV